MVHAVSTQSECADQSARSLGYDRRMNLNSILDSARCYAARSLLLACFRRLRTIANAKPMQSNSQWCLDSPWQALGLVAAATMLSACATIDRTTRESALADQTLEQMRAHAIPESALGGVVLRLSDGKALWSREATRPMQPASTIKVLTSIAALETLKPSYRARTSLIVVGDYIDDRLKGDLALVGQGSADFDLNALDGMLRSLRAQGVKTIEGDLILDRDFFQPPRDYETAPAFDESPEFRYNVVPDALLLHSNLHQLAIASVDGRINIVASPPLDRVEFVSQMNLVEKDCDQWEDSWKIPRVEKMAHDVLRVTLLGDFPKACRVNTEINVLNRTDFTERAFRASWRALGGEWLGRAREGIAPPRAASRGGTRTAFHHDSRSFAEINRDINKRSDNAFTRLAFLLLSAASTTAKADETALSYAPQPDTFARSDRVVRDWLKTKGIDDTGLVLENGSGLSRKEMISPMTLALILREAHRSVWASEFLASLPIVGIDGGMRNRLKGTKAVERGRLKTGGLRNVTSVAGYLPNANGEMMVVVLFLNHDNAVGAKGRAVLDAQMTELMKLK
jgi:serine-type D-Ala-D-Ala carboxypeptidase/endopeptidase (penicillin-binding protein 4)